MQKARLLKCKISFIAPALLMALFFIPTVKAHELKTDGSISSLIHINPNDEPVVGQPSELLFLINDKDKKFSSENCKCQASVSSNKQLLFSSPLFQGKTSYAGIFAPAIPYTFPRKDIYTITLTGEPKNIPDFQPFSISYDIRVDRDRPLPQRSSSAKTINAVIAILTLIGIFFALKKFFIEKNSGA